MSSSLEETPFSLRLGADASLVFDKAHHYDQLRQRHGYTALGLDSHDAFSLSLSLSW